MYNKNVIYRKKYFKAIPMTTIIGIKCEDGVIIGSDSQLTINGSYPAKETNYSKIFQIKKMLISGAGDTDYFEKVRSEIEKRYNSNFRRIEEATKIVEDSIKYIYDNYPCQDENISEILFSVLIGDKTYLYHIDSYHGFALEVKDFYPIGSGSVFAKYIFKRIWDKKLTVLNASFGLAYVINETTEIDQFSNMPIHIALMFNIGLITFLKKKNIHSINRLISRADKHTKSYFKDLIIPPPAISKKTVDNLKKIIKKDGDKQKKV